MRRIHLTILGVVLAASGGGWAQSSPGGDEYDTPPINYSSTQPRDPVAKLKTKLDSGQTQLAHEAQRGYLKALLDALEIPVESQVLVFSKTSFQIRQISPATPRAIYYNDDVYIGWVQDGDVIEISAVDPKLGGVFYTLDQENTEQPIITRRFGDCMQCHTSTMAQSVPGHMVRSVVTDEEGHLQLRAGTTVSNDRTSFSERFGGWYVTGQHGEMRHRGNVTLPRRDNGRGDIPELDTESGANLTDLSTRINVAPYLSSHSDMVALMVLEHQTHMHNLITRAAYHTRIAMYQQEQINASLNRPVTEISPQTKRRIERAGEALLRYLLFVDEEIFEDEISGSSDFTEQFEQAGPFDSQGRSLRELDLGKTLFEYPCSFLIYSESFDAMPKPMLEYVYRRLYDILTGRDTEPPFDMISTAKRRAVLEILRDTKENLPAYFHKD